MKKILSFILALLCAAAFSSCSGKTLSAENDLAANISADDQATYNFISGTTSAPPSYSSFKTATQSFTVKALKTICKEGENVLFSPAAVYAQLSLLQNAASGKSRSQLKRVTGKNIALDNQNACAGYFYSRLEALSGKEYVDINGDVFFGDDISVGHEFLVKSKGFYNQGLFKLDFSSDELLSEINSYIADKTQGKDKTAFKSLDGDLNLASSALFKDRWLSGYGSDSVNKGSFNGGSDVSFLNSVEYYISGKNCEGVIKDYKSTPCKFIALVPTGKTTLSQLISSLDTVEYQNIIDSMSVFNTCEASLPEFKLSGSFDFSETLKALGVTEIFSDGSFSGLTHGRKASAGVIHSFADFSVTASGSSGSKPALSDSKKLEPKKKVRFDRPFVFMVVDNEGYIPVYAGVVSKL